MSTLMTTPTPGMVSPPGAAPFGLDAIRRQVLHRVDMPGLHKDEDDDEEEHSTMAAANQDVGMNGDCEEEDAEEEGGEEGCSVGEAEGDGDGDDEAPRQPSADDEPRRNKRKNFKPRNILYDEDNPQAAAMPAPSRGGGASDSDGDEQSHGAEHGMEHGADLAAGGGLDAHGVKRRSRKPLFAPQKRYAVEEAGSPVPRFGALDLSAQGVQQPDNEDDSSAFGEDDDSRSSYPTLNHLNSGPEDESSDVNLSDGGGGGGVAPSVSMLSRNHLLKPRVHVRTHLERDRDSSSAADGDSSLDLSSADGRLFGREHRQVFGAPDASPRGPGSSSPTAEESLAADLSRARDLDSMLGAANPLGTMAAHMAAAAAFRRQGGPDQNAMKEFAEKTMRELLGIYGIGAADLGEPLGGLPMPNFASGKILEALSAGGAGAFNLGLALAAAAQQQRLSSPPSQPPTPPRTPLSPQQQQPTTPQPPKADSPQPPVRASTGTPPLGVPTYPTPTPHQQQQLAAALHAAGLTPAAGSSTEFEDFRGKLAENMSKLTGLSATSIMNDPRVMLPQNLHTILTLAALQDQGVAAKAIRTPAMPMLDAKSGGLLQGMPSLAASGLGGVAGGVPVGAGAVPGAGVAGVAAGKAAAPIDYSRYVKRFSSALECGRAFCRDLNYREHFHCIECNSRVFVKKEEMIRHFKWHKKRAESLAHGFMRYSPNDDCSDRYRDCSHNRKQTHYHCIKENCDKVYISTSDVQMHANYHRKDSAIIQEGFQRYRATEECRTEYCVFFGQRTTHFHCRREGCKYTFKNKADMEKHKTYHIKDEQLTRDGFKKFMKQDPCPFEGCRFSGNCNHIHCIRSGCSYVLHSSGQLFSHKRKHERKDSELAYRKYKLAQSMMKSLVDGQAFADQFGAVEDVGALQSLMAGLGGQPAAPQPPAQHGADAADAANRSLSPGQSQGGPNHAAPPPHPLLALQQHMPAFRLGLDMMPPPYMLEGASSAASDAPTDLSRSSPTQPGELPPSWHTPQPAPTTPQQQQSPQQAQNLPDEALWQRVSWRFSPCTAERCSQAQGLVDVIPGRGEHWHCRAEGCAMVLRAREGVLEHARNHDAQDQISEAHYVTVGGNAARASPSAGEGKCHCDQDCPYQDKEKHYHCTWDNCREIILPSDKPFRRLDHYKMHEYSRKLSQSRDPLTTMHLASSIDAMFRRKRGRPPKNRVIEVWNDYNTLELLQEGFMLFEQGEGSRCGDALCSLSGRRHFHCKQPRCFYATDREDVLLMHARDFHDNIDILPGFVFFDRSIDCRLPGCPSNRANRHFHCSRPACGYSFVRYSNMAQHEAKHRGEANNNNQDSDKPVADALGLNMSAAMGAMGTPLREMSPVGSAAGTMSPLAGAGGSTGGSLPGTPSPAPGTPRSRPPSTPQQHLSDQGRTTDIVKTEPDASAAGSHSLARLLQHHAEAGAAVNAMLPSPTASTPSSAASATPQHPATLPEWMSPDRHVRYGPEQSCSRPFCKLKRKEHYHCNACNQAFSELERLRPHIAKHSTGALSPGTPLKREGAATPEDSNEDAGDQPSGAAVSGLPADHPAAVAMAGLPTQGMLGLPPHAGMHGQVPGFAPHPFNAAMAAAVANQQLALMTSQGLPYLQHGMPAIYSSPSGLMFACSPSGFGAPHPLSANGLLDHRLDGVPGVGVGGVPGLHAQHLALKRAMSPHIMGGHQDMSPEAKKARIQNSMRILKDEPVPDGYIRFRFNEDCKYPHCGYREHQTHFHCMRQDCGYSFCDKTRFVQHTARHERLDTLMGGDFQQFRANVSCNRPDCVYTSTLGAMQNKASHFHCLKCEFVCTDTNKVVAHRRQHQKLDSIMAAGFEKFTPSQPCHSESCAHSGKQTHYHCLSCHYAVLGLSQMSAHKFRHMD